MCALLSHTLHEHGLVVVAGPVGHEGLHTHLHAAPADQLLLLHVRAGHHNMATWPHTPDWPSRTSTLSPAAASGPGPFALLILSLLPMLRSSKDLLLAVMLLNGLPRFAWCFKTVFC
jgi:hypothetical protein